MAGFWEDNQEPKIIQEYKNLSILKLCFWDSPWQVFGKTIKSLKLFENIKSIMSVRMG